MQRTRITSRLLALAGAVLLAGLLAVPSAIGRQASPRARAASSLLVGVGDEHAKLFKNPLWQQLHTKIVRYIAPYDAAVRGDELGKAREWIHAAETQHQQVLVAFYHSEHTPTVLPSVATYQRDVKKFVALFPRVHQYQSYDEANRGNVPGAFSSPSATLAAQYYQALLRSCTIRCTVIGLDVLDANNIGPTLEYISEFKREIGRLRTIMPKIWGLHDYSDVNRYESWRTREIDRALGGQVWLTETGGIVQFGSFTNRNGSGLTRAASVVKYVFALAHSQPQITRLYLYDWTGGNASTRFDAGLMSAREQPRPGYVVLCRALHAAKCNVKLSRN